MPALHTTAHAHIHTHTHAHSHAHVHTHLEECGVDVLITDTEGLEKGGEILNREALCAQDLVPNGIHTSMVSKLK